MQTLGYLGGLGGGVPVSELHDHKEASPTVQPGLGA